MQRLIYHGWLNRESLPRDSRSHAPDEVRSKCLDLSSICIAEYSDIKQDSAFLGQQEFPQQYDPPENLAFSNSIALFPAGELRQAIAREYQQQCQNLCYGNYPTWEEIEACFWELRDRL